VDVELKIGISGSVTGVSRLIELVTCSAWSVAVKFLWLSAD
jgi:hypothetical protein